MTDNKDAKPNNQSPPPESGNTTYDLHGAIERARRRRESTSDINNHSGSDNQESMREGALEISEVKMGDVTHDLKEESLRAIARAKQQPAQEMLVSSDKFTDNMVMRLDPTDGTGTAITLSVQGELVVGRADNVTDYIPDIDLTPHGAYRLGLSRRHAIILRDGDTLQVKDLGSRNGTFVNGHQVASGGIYPLKDGNEIRFGNLALRLTFQRKN